MVRRKICNIAVCLLIFCFWLTYISSMGSEMRPYKMVPDRNSSKRHWIILPAYWPAVVLFHDKSGKQYESHPFVFIWSCSTQLPDTQRRLKKIFESVRSAPIRIYPLKSGQKLGSARTGPYDGLKNFITKNDAKPRIFLKESNFWEFSNFNK